MNTPQTLSIDIEEQRRWLLEHKAERGFSWEDLAPKIGVPGGTLGPFGGGKYNGNNQKIADAVFRYCQLVLSQASLALQLPESPSYFETPTSRRITIALRIAQGTPKKGRMALIAGRPGTSKTTTFENYAATVPNVWHVEMKPTTRRIQTMQQHVLFAMGEDHRGPPFALTKRIEHKLEGSGGLLILDEAHYLDELALEEARSWHDETNVGLCFAGNDDVINRVMTGARKDFFARFTSRMGAEVSVPMPLDADALAQADAWSVTDPDVRAALVRLSKRDGGLRTCTRALELAGALAIQEGAAINIAHLRDAAASLPQRRAS